MTHASLFSGIGGFDLAAQWMGWENVFHCEYDPFCQKVLKHHFPNSKLYKDVRTFNATAYAGRIDLLSGGFPCQPFSAAGKRLGTEDSRHLWPQMLRIIREVKPSYVVGENVRGLLNWSGGLVFEEVCSDLEAEGYEVTPYLLPACGKNAPHRRDRIWFIAYSNECNDGRNTRSIPSKEEEERVQERNEVREPSQSGEVLGDATNSNERRNTQQRESSKSKGETEKPQESRERLKYSKLNNECSGFSGDAPDTDSTGLQKTRPKQQTTRLEQYGKLDKATPETDSWGMEGHRRRSKEFKRKTNEFNKDNSERQPKLDWKKFPTQPPICGGDDGLPKELDGITFPKWRKESIKAYGNAVVPAVVFEIFKAIQKTIT